MPVYAVVTRQTQPQKSKGGRIVTSHLTASQPVNRKKRLGLLDLAGELRNQIYAYVFNSGAVVKMVPKGHVERAAPSSGTSFKLIHNQFRSIVIEPQQKKDNAPVPTLYCTRVLGKYNRMEGLNTKWSTSFSGLVLTCRQIHREAVIYLYANTTFSIHSSNRLNSFLTYVRPTNLAAVKRLHLSHCTYGQPSKASDGIWKGKHDANWVFNCKLAVADLEHLEELKISLYVHDVPLRFSLKEAWVQPLLLFAALPLTSAEICLSSRYIGQPVGLPVRCRMAREAREKREAYMALHQLFADAISRKILGWDDESALESYKDGCKGQYKDYIADFNRDQHWDW